MSVGEPYIKYLKKEKIWELRPNQDRILFFSVNGNEFVLLHQFLKKTQKTPTREITQAQLAKKIGMSQSQLAKIETLETTPKIDTLLRILNGLGITLSLTPPKVNHSIDSHN